MVSTPTAVAIVAMFGPSQPAVGVIGKLESADGMQLLMVVTNTQGYDVFKDVPVPFVGTLKLSCGVQYYEQAVSISGNEVTLRCGPSASNPQDIQLPAVVASFRKPARARLIAVQDRFQGLTLPQGPNGNPVPMFGPFCYGLPTLAQRDAWRDVERAAGATHATRCLSVNYDDGPFSYTGAYGIPGADFTQNLPGLKALLAEDVVKGIMPELYLAGDGQAYSAGGGTYGYTWLMANMAQIVAALRDKTIGGFDFSDVGLWCHGFELITDGGWSPDNFEAAVRALRPLIGDNGVLASHIGTYTWWGDGSGSSKGPADDWASDVGQAIDVSFEEGDTPFCDASGNPLNNEQSDGWEQRASARYGPAATNIQPRNVIQWEWPQQPPETMTPRGVRTSIAKEFHEADWTRGNVSLAQINIERAWLATLGPWGGIG